MSLSPFHQKLKYMLFHQEKGSPAPTATWAFL